MAEDALPYKSNNVHDCPAEFLKGNERLAHRKLLNASQQQDPTSIFIVHSLNNNQQPRIHFTLQHDEITAIWFDYNWQTLFLKSRWNLSAGGFNSSALERNLRLRFTLTPFNSKIRYKFSLLYKLVHVFIKAPRNLLSSSGFFPVGFLLVLASRPCR